MKPKVFAIIGAILLGVFFIQLFHPASRIILYGSFDAAAVAFLIAIVLEIVSVFFGSRERKNQTAKERNSIKPKVFAIIGSILLYVLCVFFFFAINHPTWSAPWPYQFTWPITYCWLGVTALAYLTAITVKVVNVVKNK